MRLPALAVLTALALPAPLPAAAPPAGHPLLGTWELTLANHCVEKYEYRADGTLHSWSAQEEAWIEYQIDAPPDENGTYTVHLRVTRTNARPDCSGQLTPVGSAPTFYLAPLRGGYLLCADPALQRCLGPMMPVKTPARGGGVS